MDKNELVERLILEVKSCLEDSIAEDLRSKIDKVLCVNDIDIEDVKRKFIYDDTYNCFRECDNLTDREWIIMIFEENPFLLINEMIPFIAEKEISKRLSIESIEDARKEEFNIIDNLECKEFSIVTHVEKPSIDYGQGEGIVDDRTVELNIKYIDIFDKNILLEGKFSRVYGQSPYDMDHVDGKVTCNVKGILKNQEIPMFIEYFIESCIYIKHKNYKMAFLNLFSSFNNFIEIIYRKTYELYFENHDKYMKTVDEHLKDILEYDDIKSELYGAIVEKEYKFIYEQVYSVVNKDLKSKRRYYKNPRRKLIKEKLVSVLEDMKIFEDPDFEDLKENILRFSEIEKIRHCIAHGELFKFEGSIGEVAYNIITAIMSIVYEKDLFENEWDTIIYYE